MVHTVKQGKTERKSYSRINEVIEVPNLIEIQKDSYNWFLDEGMGQIFQEVSPVTDSQGIWEIYFLDKEFDPTNPVCGLEECHEKDSNYAAPLKIKLRLRNTETGESKEQEAYVGDFPIMTDHGTFVINGAERVIISQIVRSPGAYFGREAGKKDRDAILYTSQIIPNRGAWLELEEDENGVISVRVDRTRKFPLTTFLKALGLDTDEQIINMFGDEDCIRSTFEKDSCNTRAEALVMFYSKVRPGDPASAEVAASHLNGLYFDPRKYDLARVGIYKLNKKLGVSDRIVGHVIAEDVITADGEVIAKKDTKITKDLAREIEDAGIVSVKVFPVRKVGDMEETDTSAAVIVVGNGRVDADKFIRASFAAKDLKNFDIEGNTVNAIIDCLNSMNVSNLTKYSSIGNSTACMDALEKIKQYNFFLGMNLSNSPLDMIRDGWSNSDGRQWGLIIAAIVIPLLAGLTQWLNVKLMPQQDTSNTQNQSDTAASMNQSMKLMNNFMPIMSIIFCFNFSSGVGIYWIAGSVIRTIQQIIINKRIDKIDMDELIEKNLEKRRKKLEKKGIDPNKVDKYARFNTKNISAAPVADTPKKTMSDKASVKGVSKKDQDAAMQDSVDSSEGTVKKYAPGSLAAKANLVSEYNNRKDNK